MKIQLLSKNAKMPVKSHLPDCGLDIFMPVGFTLEPLDTKTIGLGLAVAIPEGFAGILVPRSSIAEKGLIIQPSIIDVDYTGEIHLIITNCSKKIVEVHEGDRVCSIVCMSVLNPYLEQVEQLPPSVRGSHGLGSTGK